MTLVHYAWLFLGLIFGGGIWLLHEGRNAPLADENEVIRRSAIKKPRGKA